MIDADLFSPWKMNVKVTTIEDCKEELIYTDGSSAIHAYQDWKTGRRKRPREVIEFVEGFRHSFLYVITSKEVEYAKTRSMEPYAGTRQDDYDWDTKDLNIDFALQHLFHKYLEEKWKVPDWDQFFDYIKYEITDMYWTPAHKKWAGKSDEEIRRLERGLQRRLGDFYMSAIRELDVLVRMREVYGIHLRYHLLADVLLKVDFWIGNQLISIYKPNGEYRQGNNGRKIKESDIFGKPFEITELIVTPTRERIWCVSETQLNSLARKIREKQND